MTLSVNFLSPSIQKEKMKSWNFFKNLFLVGTLFCLINRPVYSELEERTLLIEGVKREYLLALPKGISASTPVLLVLHGGGGSGKKISKTN